MTASYRTILNTAALYVTVILALALFSSITVGA